MFIGEFCCLIVFKLWMASRSCAGKVRTEEGGRRRAEGGRRRRRRSNDDALAFLRFRLILPWAPSPAARHAFRCSHVRRPWLTLARSRPPWLLRANSPSRRRPSRTTPSSSSCPPSAIARYGGCEAAQRAAQRAAEHARLVAHSRDCRLLASDLTPPGYQLHVRGPHADVREPVSGVFERFARLSPRCALAFPFLRPDATVSTPTRADASRQRRHLHRPHVQVLAQAQAGGLPLGRQAGARVLRRLPAGVCCPLSFTTRRERAALNPSRR